MPDLKPTNTIFENFRQLLIYPQSPLIYGLFRRDALIDAGIEDEFDWWDMYALHSVSLQGRMSLDPTILFHTGVRGGAKTPQSLGQAHVPGLNYSYGPYVRRMTTLITRCPFFTRVEKARLLVLYASELAGFLRGLEPRVASVKPVLHVAQRAVLHVDHKYFSAQRS
jgi:hypothetical protein